MSFVQAFKLVNATVAHHQLRCLSFPPLAMSALREIENGVNSAHSDAGASLISKTDLLRNLKSRLKRFDPVLNHMAMSTSSGKRIRESAGSGSVQLFETKNSSGKEVV